MEDILLGMRGTNVLHTLSMGESRTVDLFEGDQGLEVWEETRGPVTLDLFGTPTHVNRVALGGESLARACALLGHASGDAVAALSEFFQKREKTAMDLIDWLDRAGISYESGDSPDGFLI
ncbi:MAG: hypothetical protein LKF00_02475 [Olsenella sp.]|jgi:hypothetical protein|nr:hypothetical protein [Olsenella sp.]MCI1289683.1 hypothetical protein [Olsenella sp.]